MHANISVLWTTFTPLLLAALGAVWAWGQRLAAQDLKIKQGSALYDDFDQAASHGLAALEAELQSIAAHNSSVAIPEAFANAVGLVTTYAPAVVSALGLSPQFIANFLGSKLSPASQATVAAHVAANGPITLSPAAK